MLTRTIKREKDGARFVVTFDEFHVVDTITRNGKTITSADRDARKIIGNGHLIAAGIAPSGYAWERTP